jgi:uncharacterized protein (DUF362 family)
MGKKVSLVRVQNSYDIKNAISKAIDLIEYKPKSPVNTVVIKPNLCYYWGPATGETTDPLVVAELIDFVRERYGNDLAIKIVEADATAMKTKHVFPMLGYTKLAQEKKVELQNLSQDILEEKRVKINGVSLTFKVPNILLDSDLFINVPKLKIMRATTITCAFKNIFGCNGYPKKIEYHGILDEAIVGINKILKPNLTIVDGLVALGKFPEKLDLIMASEDSFSIDWVAAKIMNYNPSKIRYLKIAMKEAVGSPGVCTVGEKIESFRQKFPSVNNSVTTLLWNLQVNLLKLYCRLTQDNLLGELEES